MPLGITFFSTECGLAPRTIQAFESARRSNLSLQHVHALAVYYDVSIVGALRNPRAPKGPKTPDDYAVLDDAFRTNLRLIRLGHGFGTKRLAMATQVSQPWLVRIESGEIATLDLVRLERVAAALQTTLADLATTP
jgi:transcriptional regulator with XRE-family HTH domain